MLANWSNPPLGIKNAITTPRRKITAADMYRSPMKEYGWPLTMKKIEGVCDGWMGAGSGMVSGMYIHVRNTANMPTNAPKTHSLLVHEILSDLRVPATSRFVAISFRDPEPLAAT